MIWLSVFYFVATTVVALWSLKKVANANCPPKIKKTMTSLFIISAFGIICSHTVVWDMSISHYLAETHNKDLILAMLFISIYDWLLFRVSNSLESS